MVCSKSVVERDEVRAPGTMLFLHNIYDDKIYVHPLIPQVLIANKKQSSYVEYLPVSYYALGTSLLQ